MGWAESAEEWFAIGAAIRTIAIKIVETASSSFNPARGLKDPTVFAVILLSRTVESSRATLVLAERGFLVEAGMVARSCFENVLWMRSLVKSGSDFVNTIIDDGARADASIAELVQELGISENSDAINDIIDRKTKVRIDLKKLRNCRDGEMEYTLFRMLSNEYGHVSRSSLLRHIIFTDTGDPEIDMRPPVKRHDLLWVMFLTAANVVNAAHLFIMSFSEDERSRFVDSGDAAALETVHDRLCQMRDSNGLA